VNARKKRRFDLPDRLSQTSQISTNCINWYIKNRPLTNILSRGWFKIVISGRDTRDLEKIQAIKRNIVINAAREKMKDGDNVVFLLKIYRIKAIIKIRLNMRLNTLPI